MSAREYELALQRDDDHHTQMQEAAYKLTVAEEPANASG